MADLKINIKGSAESLKRAVTAARGHLNKLGKSIADFSRSSLGLGLGAIAAGLALFARGAIKAAAAFEDTAVSFGVMIGNAERAKEVLDELMMFSTKTPFEPKEVFDAAKTLMAFGVSANEVGKKLKFLGDISAGTGKDLNELARIFGKAFVKGKVQAEELNQLSEAGVPIIKQLQKEYNKTAEEIFKMGSQGKLSFDVMQNAMVKMTEQGGTFFDMMSKKSETFNGKLSTLKGNWENFKISIGQAGTGGGKTIIDRLNQALELYNFGAKLLGGTLDRNRGAEGEFGAMGDAIDKGTIQIARIEREKTLQARKRIQMEADARKEEAEARLKSQDKQAVSILKKGISGGSGVFESLGGDISGGAFDSRMTVQREQLQTLKNIQTLAEQLVQHNPGTTREMELYINDMKDIFKE